MSISLPSSVSNVAIGNAAGWMLEFYAETADGALANNPTLTLGSRDYYADLHATLPNGLEPGTYTFTIEGMTDHDYKTLKQGADGQAPPTAIKLYLYWRDANASVGGYLANLAGLSDVTGELTGDARTRALVAVVAIKPGSISRKAGKRRYETTILAQERVYSLLATHKLSKSATGPFKAVIDHIRTCAQTIAITPYGLTSDGSLPTSGGTASKAPTSIDAGTTCLTAVTMLARSLEQATRKAGRGMLLIRDGALHLGPRPIPFNGSDPTPLTLGGGLIEAESLGSVSADPNLSSEASSGNQAPVHQQFKLTLKGRPDLKPGDLVTFDPSPEDVATTIPSLGSALLGAATGLAGPLVSSLDVMTNPTTMYVTSVEHRLGRTSGFVTFVSGVVIADSNHPWDTYSPGGSQPASVAPEQPKTTDGAVHAAHAIRQVAASISETRRFADVGEVRQMTTSGQDSAEPPAQTLTVWRGLEESQGQPNEARGLAIQRATPAPLRGVAYATPFAWGQCGLVLPRYPGMRVALLHRNGQASDPIDVGALWPSGHGPASQAGDWWLILPVGVDPSQRDSVDDSTTPQEHSGNVTNDLIDAEGNRIIEVGELTLRIGRNSLKSAGTRPARGQDQDAITIEHADGKARVVIKSDGTVVIHAAKDLQLEAGGDIKMQANNVKVSVSGSMDVS